MTGDDLSVKVAELRGEMHSGFARVEGALDTMTSGLDATRREVDQMVKFQSELIKQHDIRLHLIETDRVADRDRASDESSAVRVGLEARLEAAQREFREAIDELQRRADRQDGLIKGMGILAGFVVPTVTTVVLRLIF